MDMRERVAQAIEDEGINWHNRIPTPRKEYWLRKADAAIAECFRLQPMETAPKDGTEVLVLAAVPG